MIFKIDIKTALMRMNRTFGLKLFSMSYVSVGTILLSIGFCDSANAQIEGEGNFELRESQSQKDNVVPRRRVIGQDAPIRLSTVGIQNWNTEALRKITVKPIRPPQESKLRDALMEIVKKHELKPENWRTHDGLSSQFFVDYKRFCEALAKECKVDSKALLKEPVGKIFQNLSPSIGFGGSVWGEKISYLTINFGGKRLEAITNVNFNYLRSVHRIPWGPCVYSVDAVFMGDEELTAERQEFLKKVLNINGDFNESLSKWVDGPVQVITPNTDENSNEAFEAVVTVLQFYCANCESLIQKYNENEARYEALKAMPKPVKKKVRLNDLVYNVSKRASNDSISKP